MNNLLYALLFYTIGQGIIWFQVNGQFVWPWFQKNPWLTSFIFGGFASYFFITATQHAYVYFNQALWPTRFMSFASGILVFTIFTWIFFQEGVNLKTAVSLLLAFALLAVQLFWKI